MELFNWEELSKKSTIESHKEIISILKTKSSKKHLKDAERLLGGCETRGQVLQIKEQLAELCENTTNKCNYCAEVFEKEQPIRERFINTVKIIDKLNLEDEQKADIIISYGILLNRFPEDIMNKRFYESFIVSAATSDLETLDYYNICVEDFIKDKTMKGILVINKDESIEKQIDSSKKILRGFIKDNPNEVCQKIARARNKKMRSYRTNY